MKLAELCRDFAPLVEAPNSINAEALLLAIADVESSAGTQNLPRFEPAYSIGGFYWKRARHVRQEWRRWGDFAACSFSSWQILFVVAFELGFRGDPIALREDVLAVRWVVELLNRRIFGREAKTVRDVADGWNSGSFKDANVPQAYVEKLEAAYAQRLAEARGGWEGGRESGGGSTNDG